MKITDPSNYFSPKYKKVENPLISLTKLMRVNLKPLRYKTETIQGWF